jgi:hypothetical protein
MATDTPPGHGSTQYLETRQRVHATAARLRRRAYVVAAMVGSLNRAHFARSRLLPTAAAVEFGIPPDQPRDPRPADPGPRQRLGTRRRPRLLTYPLAALRRGCPGCGGPVLSDTGALTSAIPSNRPAALHPATRSGAKSTRRHLLRAPGARAEYPQHPWAVTVSRGAGRCGTPGLPRGVEVGLPRVVADDAVGFDSAPALERHDGLCGVRRRSNRASRSPRRSRPFRTR